MLLIQGPRITDVLGLYNWIKVNKWDYLKNLFLSNIPMNSLNDKRAKLERVHSGRMTMD
jgi:hypothetical protein